MRTAPADIATPGWWQNRSILGRFVKDLVEGELQRLRPGAGAALLKDRTENLEIGPAGLGADSLELITLATALTEALHLHRSGVEDLLLARRQLSEWIDIAAVGLSHYAETVTFRTSGSTGQPKPCQHGLNRLLEETEHLARILGPVRRIVSLVPSHHIYGFLFTALLPQQLGIPILDGRGRLPARVAADLRSGDLLVGVPELWTSVAQSGIRFAPGVRAVTSTGPLAPEVFRALEAQGLDKILEVYGSSETAGIGWRASADEPYQLFPYWQLRADGTEISHAGSSLAVALQDKIHLLSPGQFHVAGRLDGAVQVGGVNVFPDRVAAVLRLHPGVQDAAVRSFGGPGALRLKAFIVPRDKAAGPVFAAELRDWAETRLSIPECPKSWTVGEALPRTPLGKAADWHPLMSPEMR